MNTYHQFLTGRDCSGCAQGRRFFAFCFAFIAVGAGYLLGR